jgi:phosphopantetheinyl transferase (holo-ACP synthase)
MSIGNDVVDLRDPESQPAALHSRFDGRVFSPRERELLERAASPHVMRWALWASKESSFKAMKRLEPDTRFSPRAFAADLSLHRGPGGRATASGSVVHLGCAFDVETRFGDDNVHAIALLRGAPRTRLLSRTRVADLEPSIAVRRLAAFTIADALGLDRAGIAIGERPPVATYHGRPLDVTLSLSHHGRYVAFVCGLPFHLQRDLDAFPESGKGVARTSTETSHPLGSW